MRLNRLTGSLTSEERSLIAAAAVPSEAEQATYLAALTAAVEKFPELFWVADVNGPQVGGEKVRQMRKTTSSGGT
jgi:hypothetical protein